MSDDGMICRKGVCAGSMFVFAVSSSTSLNEDDDDEEGGGNDDDGL